MIDEMCMLNSSSNIPYFNDNGIFRYKNCEIANGMGTKAAELFTVPVWDVEWGQRKVDFEGEKYVPPTKCFKVNITPTKISHLRRRMVNDKSAGHFDKIP